MRPASRKQPLAELFQPSLGPQALSVRTREECDFRMLPQQTKRCRFDVGQYHRMLETGILSEDDRIELIDGEIVEMTPAVCIMSDIL